MAVTYELVKSVAAELYSSCLKKIPEDTKDALRGALDAETNDGAKKILALMLRSAQVAEDTKRLVCSDAGIPVYFVKIGTAARLEGNIKQAISDGFDHLVATIDPPILKHVTNPLTRERGYKGKDMPIVSYDLIDGADYIEITCSPKALGSGRWAALEIFSFPTLDVIEKYVMDCVLKAVNQTGFGPMGTGGDTTALAVHIEYASGHGFTPVAVCFNCWINRRASARIYDSGEIVRFE